MSQLFQNKLIRARKPYGGCEEIDAEQNRLLNLWSIYGYNCTTETCYDTYKQYAIISKCDCLHV